MADVRDKSGLGSRPAFDYSFICMERLRMERPQVPLPILALLASLLSALGAGEPLPDPPLVYPCEPGIPGGRLVISTFTDPKTFNPITQNEQSSDDIVRMLFAGLVDYDIPAQAARPALAESWSVGEDQRTWTFKLRKGLRWSDGHPLTADDVLFTWQVIYDTNVNSVMVDIFRIDGKNFEVRKVDDVTVTITTPEVYAPFLVYAGGVPIIPRHILEPAVTAKNLPSAYGVNTPADHIIGSGPFRLRAFKPGQSTLLERNPWFYGVDRKGQRLPYFDNVIYVVVPDMNAMSLRLFSGESDVHEAVRPDEFDRFKAESAKGRFVLHELGPGLDRSFLFFNMNTNANPKTGKPYVDPVKLKWFRNAKFRQAIAHAIDRESICRTILGGHAEPNYSFGSKANPKWYNPNIQAYPFDLARSRALLKEIGIEDRDGDGKLEDAEGHPVQFVIYTVLGNPLREKTAVLMKSDFTKLGLQVITKPMDFNNLGDRLYATYDFDAMLAALGGGDTDPTSSMNVLRSDGFTHWWFPRQKAPSTEWEARIDFLMSAQVKTLDYAQRKKYVDEVQEIMNRELPFIYTAAPLHAAAIRSDIGNVRPTVLSTHRVTWNAEELYFKRKP
jgi:peptide/nickel transport system substrate-binding protein